MTTLQINPLNPAGLDAVVINPLTDPVGFFLNLDIILQIIVIVTAIAAAISLVMLVAVPLAVRKHRQLQKEGSKSQKNLYKDVGEFIALLHHHNKSVGTPEIQKLLHSIQDEIENSDSKKLDLRRKLVINSHFMNEELHGLIAKTYQALDLNKAVNNDIKSGDTNRKILAVQESGILQLKSNADLIYDYIKNDHEDLKTVAMVALVHIAPERLSDILEVEHIYLTDWQQIQLIEALKSKPRTDLPDLSPFLHSENQQVVIFALRYKRTFLRKDPISAIRTLAFSENEAIATEALKSLRTLNDSEAIQELKETFDERPVAVRELILSLIGKTGSEGEDGAFLLEIFSRETHPVSDKAFLAYMNLTGADRFELAKHLNQSKPNKGMEFPLEWFHPTH